MKTTISKDKKIAKTTMSEWDYFNYWYNKAGDILEGKLIPLGNKNDEISKCIKNCSYFLNKIKRG